jgi:MFS family permease
MKKMEHNARICTFFFPLWAIPYTVYTYYLSLFLMDCGVSESQLGLLMTVSNTSALVCSVVASPIVDHLGRKRATLVFDLISSALPPLLYLVSQNFIVALIAMAIAGMNRIMSVGYYLLMVEDSSEENSLAAMNWFNLILVGSGLATSIAGAIIAKLGLVRSEKLFLLISFICMTALSISRNFLLKETPTGTALMKERKGFSFKAAVDSYAGTFHYIARSRRALSAMIVNGIVYVYYTIGTSVSLFFTPYFSTRAGLSGAELGMVGTVYAIGTLVSMFLINPYITKENIYRFTVFSCISSLAGFAMIILCPEGSTVLLFVSIIVISLSYGVLKTVADSLLAIETEGQYRSGVYSCSFFVSSILSILAISVVQALYAISPDWLFGSSAVLVALVLVNCLLVAPRRRKDEKL